MVNHYHISTVLFISALLLAIYLAIYITLQLIDERRPMSFKSTYVYPPLKVIYEYFKPVSFLIVMMLLIAFWPYFFGPLFAIVALFSYRLVLDYLEGLVLSKSIPGLSKGTEILIDDQLCQILKVGHIGMDVVTASGLKNIRYHKISNGKIDVVNEFETPVIAKFELSREGEISLGEVKNALFSSPFVGFDSNLKVGHTDLKNAIKVDLVLPSKYFRSLLMRQLTGKGYNINVPE